MSAHPDNAVAPILAQMNEDAAERTADLVARWRVLHPEATCSDTIAALLAEMENAYTKRGT